MSDIVEFNILKVCFYCILVCIKFRLKLFYEKYFVSICEVYCNLFLFIMRKYFEYYVFCL